MNPSDSSISSCVIPNPLGLSEEQERTEANTMAPNTTPSERSLNITEKSVFSAVSSVFHLPSQEVERRQPTSPIASVEQALQSLEWKRQILERFVVKCGWNQPEYAFCTLQKVLLWKFASLFNEEPTIPRSTFFSLFLKLFGTFEEGLPSSKEMVQEIQKALSQPEKNLWLTCVAFLLDEKEFLGKTIGYICHLPEDSSSRDSRLELEQASRFFIQALLVFQCHGKKIVSESVSSIKLLADTRSTFRNSQEWRKEYEDTAWITSFLDANEGLLRCIDLELGIRIKVCTKQLRQVSSSSSSQLSVTMQKYLEPSFEKLSGLIQTHCVFHREIILFLHKMLKGKKMTVLGRAQGSVLLSHINIMKDIGYEPLFSDESIGNTQTIYFSKIVSEDQTEEELHKILWTNALLSKEMKHMRIFLNWLSEEGKVAFSSSATHSSQRTTNELFSELQLADLLDQEEKEIGSTREHLSRTENKAPQGRKQKKSVSPPPDQKMERLSPPPQCLRSSPSFIIDTQTFEERSLCSLRSSSTPSIPFLSSTEYANQYLTSAQGWSIPSSLTRLSAHQFDALSSHLDHLFSRQTEGQERHEGRCQELINGVFHHAFLSACGFEIMCSLIQKRRFDLLPTVFPMWSSDRYLQAESSFDMISLLCQNREGLVHSLNEVYEEIRLFLPLPQELETYIQGNSWGLFSYRYFMSLKEKFVESGEALTGEVELIDILHTRFRSGEFLSLDDLHRIIEALCTLQGFSFQFLHHVLSREEGFGLSSLPISSSKLDELKACLHTAIDHPETLEESDIQESRFDREKNVLHDLLGRCEALQGMCQRASIDERLQQQKAISFRELINHLRLLQQSFDLISLFRESHFSAFHERNLLQVNWCMEEILRLAVMQRRGERLTSHNFNDYLAFFEDEQKGSFVAQLQEYNSGIGIQYETSYKKRVPALERYRERLLPASIEQGRCEETFHPASSRVGNMSLVIEDEVRGVCRLLLRAVDFLERHFHEDMSATGSTH